MSDTTGGEAGDDEDSASESSFGSSAVCYGGDLMVSAWFSSCTAALPELASSLELEASYLL